MTAACSHGHGTVLFRFRSISIEYSIAAARLGSGALRGKNEQTATHRGIAWPNKLAKPSDNAA
jgi:hypothetical protein